MVHVQVNGHASMVPVWAGTVVGGRSQPNFTRQSGDLSGPRGVMPLCHTRGVLRRMLF